jgi:hypothetical protein
MLGCYVGFKASPGVRLCFAHTIDNAIDREKGQGATPNLH